MSAAAWHITRVTDQAGIDAVMAVDAVAFLNPWTRAMYAEELARPERAFVYLARAAGEAVGYCAVWLVDDELHINNLAVVPAWRGRGLGRALLAHACGAAASHGARRATLEVRRSNTAARRLYGSAGFVEAGVRAGYYRAPAEDAVLLWRALETTQSV